MSDKVCVWNMGTEHDGEIENAIIFSGSAEKGVKVPICEKHLKEHRVVVALHSAGLDVETILQETVEQRQQEYDKLVANGTINPNDIKQ